MSNLEVNSKRALQILWMFFYFGPLGILVDLHRVIGSATHFGLNLMLKVKLPTFMSAIKIPFSDTFKKLFTSSKHYIITAYDYTGDFLNRLTTPVVEHCWDNLLSDLTQNNFSALSFMQLRCLLYFKPDIINRPINFKNEQVRILDLIIREGTMRFDVINFLIQQGAIFDNISYPIFMIRECSFFDQDSKYGDKYFNIKQIPFYSNSICFLAESLRNLSLDPNAVAQYQKAKEEFKEIIDYIIQKHGPNVRMNYGIPLITFMSDKELIEYLIAKGADPELTNPQLSGNNVQETLLQFDEFERLRMFVEAGFNNIRNLKERILQGNLSTTCFALRTPLLANQLSDIDKAHLINTNVYRAQKNNLRYIFRTSYTSTNLKLKNYVYVKVDRGEFINLLADVIFDLGKKSEEVYKILDHFNVFFKLTNLFTVKNNEKYVDLLNYWEEQNKNKQRQPISLKDWQCLPEGIAPRFDINELDENKYNFFQLRANAREILGVPDNAQDNAILNAYRRLSLKCHPDKNHSPVADEEMSCINKARSILLK